ncbi:MAG: hypothetical protein Q7J46_07315 [Pseudomonas sp.]|jgi:hypothetical protein|nr:hypothetical protein [Pseudomonas sp.]
MTERSARSSGKPSLNEQSEENFADNEGWIAWRNLTTEAMGRFHEQLLASVSRAPGLVGYEAAKRARAANGNFAWSWGAAAEIQETTNTINSWGVHLHDWCAWNAVVESFETDEDKGQLLHHFVNPLAFFCMHQPSALSDRLMLLTETLLHQANCLVEPGYVDRLDQDGLRPGQGLRRSDRRKQVIHLGHRWTRFNGFLAALDAMNDSAYRKLSRNFRDLSVHSFAPRFMVGQIMRAVRSIEPWQEIVEQPGGGSLLVDHPTKKCVSYTMAVLEPFPLRDAFSSSLSEYQKVLAAMSAFSELLEEICDGMDAIPDRLSGQS